MIVTTFVTTNYPRNLANLISGARRTYHLLRTYFPVFLDIPEAQRASLTRYKTSQHANKTCSPSGRSDSLGQTEVCVLQERELELVVLADRHKCTGRVEALRHTIEVSSRSVHELAHTHVRKQEECE